MQLNEASLTGWPAALDLGFERRGNATLLAHRSHQGPLRVQKALHPEGPETAHVLIVHPPAGIAGGDHLTIRARLGAATHAFITTPGAAKWYKSNGQDARQDIDIVLQEDALLEWLPQESIFFNACRARMSLRFDLAASARLCGWDIAVLGRKASGERFTEGLLTQHLQIRRAGKLLWAERAHVAGNDPVLDSMVGWAGQHVSGLFWAVGMPLDEALLEACRSVTAEGLRLGVTLFPHGLLLARVLGDSPERVRSVLTSVWSLIRPAFCGRPGNPPRIWAT